MERCVNVKFVNSNQSISLVNLESRMTVTEQNSKILALKHDENENCLLSFIVRPNFLKDFSFHEDTLKIILIK